MLKKLTTTILMLILIMIATSCTQDIASIEDPRERQLAEAELRDIPVEFTDEYGIEYVLIPRGSFIMGAEDTEIPQHEVTFKQGFYISKYEITEAQYNEVFQDSFGAFVNPSDIYPAQVSYDHMLSYTASMDDQTKHRAYRLSSSEAHWEYACRAGSSTDYIWGNAINPEIAKRYAWYKNWQVYGPRAIGQKTPNTWGIYDMHGNVEEWCTNNYAGLFNMTSQPTFHGHYWEFDEYSKLFVARGGRWDSDITNISSTSRDVTNIANEGDDIKLDFASSNPNWKKGIRLVYYSVEDWESYVENSDFHSKWKLQP